MWLLETMFRALNQKFNHLLDILRNKIKWTFLHGCNTVDQFLCECIRFLSLSTLVEVENQNSDRNESVCCVPQYL